MSTRFSRFFKHRIVLCVFGLVILSLLSACPAVTNPLPIVPIDSSTSPTPNELLIETADGDGFVTVDSESLGGRINLRIEDLDEQPIPGAQIVVMKHGDRIVLSFEADGHVPMGIILRTGADGKVLPSSKLHLRSQAANPDDQIEAALHAMQASLLQLLDELSRGTGLSDAIIPIKLARSALSLMALFESDTLGWDPPESFLGRLAYRGTASLRDVRNILGVGSVATLFIPEPTASKVLSVTLFAATLTIDLAGVAGVDLDQPLDWYQLPGTSMWFCLPNDSAPRTHGISLSSSSVSPSEFVYGEQATVTASVRAQHPEGAAFIAVVEVRFLTPEGRLHDFNVFVLNDEGLDGDSGVADEVFTYSFAKNRYAAPGIWTALFSAEDSRGFATESQTRYVTIQEGGGSAGGAYPESSHPYLDSYDNEWTYTLPGSHASIDVTFDAQTETESGWDFIYVMDGAGNQVSGSPFDGTDLASQTLNVPGSTVRIRLTTDGSVTRWGFRVTEVRDGG